MLMRTTMPARPATATIAAAGIALAGTATIAGAWFIELVLKYPPCPLCLTQRIPYYAAIPLAVVVALMAQRGAPRTIIIAGLLGLAGLMLWGAGVGAYHAGIEWKLWVGPTDCSGPINSFGGNLMKQLESINIVRCDQPALLVLGLSLAGWNVLVSLALAAAALAGAAATWRRRAEA